MQKLKHILYRIIFGTETPAGRAFDVVLLWAILLSVLTVVLESVKSVRVAYPGTFQFLEWFFTILFTAEYILRILTHPRKYITSFFGIIDLLAVLPTYAGLFFLRSHFLLTVRAFRLLRIFRILKLGRYMHESQVLISALKKSMYKIIVFFGVVLTLVLFLGTLMYLVEGERNGFTSIPQSIYWAIVTITTVGYGDIAPATVLGKFISSVAMLIGYSIIAVPTGIITVEISDAVKSSQQQKQLTCPSCDYREPDKEARFCKKCGTKLE
ncbi:ion transporter [Prolixibacter bellariivorans]|uniref:Ion transporter n=1 Tax=Prolixibacter bellariivorans TaxID=314319 RepID=A0A5M4AYF1_9BACT|nr:ion transporter [Prolixibacter bellariivorans]GET32930.1 ion transporter [Prolixibacter bellariivorans]